MSRIGSVYLTDEEHEALERLSRERRTSRNAVLRIALRRLLGLPVPEWARELEQERLTTS